MANRNPVKEYVYYKHLFISYVLDLVSFSGKTVPKKIISRTTSHKTSFWQYESEKMNDTDNWSDPYGDEQGYYGGWSREDVESGLADAYE